MIFDGIAPSRAQWINGDATTDSINFIVAGYSKDAQRRLALFDRRKVSEPVDLKLVDASNRAGAPMMFWNAESSTLCLAGKGETSIKFYNIDPSSRISFLSEYSSDSVQAGIYFMLIV